MFSSCSGTSNACKQEKGYSSITDGVGGRSLTYLMAHMVQEQCAELSLEQMESLPFLRLLDQLDKQKKVLCTGGAGAWRK